MTEHARKSPYRDSPPNCSDRGFDWLHSDLGFLDDPLLAFAYQVSDGAITFVGPIFWMCLVYLFVLAELGN